MTFDGFHVPVMMEKDMTIHSYWQGPKRQYISSPSNTSENASGVGQRLLSSKGCCIVQHMVLRRGLAQLPQLRYDYIYLGQNSVFPRCLMARDTHA